MAKATADPPTDQVDETPPEADAPEADAPEEATATVALAPEEAQTVALALVHELEQMGAITPTSLTLTSDVPWDRYYALMGYFGRVKDTCSFYIGDGLLHGERVWGEMYAQAEEATGLAPGTLQNYTSVCNRVAPDRRRLELKFSHHYEVAALDPDEQVVWLTRAVDEGLSSRKLRELISEAKGGAAPEPEPAEPAGEATLSRCEVLETAASLLWHQGQRATDGSVVVQPEHWAQLGAALGEGE